MLYALESIARATGLATADNAPASTGITVTDDTASHIPEFDVMRQACDQAELGFQINHGPLVMTEAVGQDVSIYVNLVSGLLKLVGWRVNLLVCSPAGTPFWIYIIKQVVSKNSRAAPRTTSAKGLRQGQFFMLRLVKPQGN